MGNVYAIIDDIGVQHKVAEGETITVDLKSAEAGSTITFDRVLLVVDGEEITVGQPTVDNAKVTATVLGLIKGKKIEVATFKRRKDSRRHIGHRQKYTEIRIDKIQM